MNFLKIYCDSPQDNKINAAIFLSGTGSNAEKILEFWQKDRHSRLEIVAIVTDRPESRAAAIGEAYGIPVINAYIREFYHSRGLKRLSIATPEGKAAREAWTDSLREALAPYNVDFGIFAGFIPLTNITGDFPCLNVHPGDLTYIKDGQRYLVGLHTIPVERSIVEGLDYMRSSVIIAEPFEEGDDMDSGPILGVSQKVTIDLQGKDLTELKALYDSRPDKRPVGGYKDELESVAGHNQELLKINGDWTVFPHVVFEFAKGNYAVDENKQLYYKEDGNWQPVKTVEYLESGNKLVL